MLCLRWIEPYSCCLLWVTFFKCLSPHGCLLSIIKVAIYFILAGVLSDKTQYGCPNSMQHSMFFYYLLSSYELWNYLFLAGSKYVAFKLQCFVLILHKLLYSLGKNILRRPCFILALFHCGFCFFMSIRNEKKSLFKS